MSDYLTGLAALLTGMQTERARFVILCAFAAGLAFLTRPEGASVLVIGLAVLLSQRSWKFKRRIGLAAAMKCRFAHCKTTSGRSMVLAGQPSFRPPPRGGAEESGQRFWRFRQLSNRNTESGTVDNAHG